MYKALYVIQAVATWYSGGKLGKWICNLYLYVYFIIVTVVLLAGSQVMMNDHVSVWWPLMVWCDPNKTPLCLHIEWYVYAN